MESESVAEPLLEFCDILATHGSVKTVQFYFSLLRMFKPRSKVNKAAKRREISESSDSSQSSVSFIQIESDSKRRRAGLTETRTEKGESQKDSDVTDRKGADQMILSAEDAFRVSGIDPGRDEDTRAQHERNREIQKQIASGELEEGVYRGQNAYRAYVPQDDERRAANAKFTGALGPNRSAANLRTTSRFDYQMDVCKDFKETGYCGFGDSCKFLHDRSDYKTGWELEREWNDQQRRLEKERVESARKGSIEEEEVDERNMCSACKKIWRDCTSPSCVTSCGHYFCEQCFVSTSMVSCASCGKPTNGIFSTP